VRGVNVADRGGLVRVRQCPCRPGDRDRDRVIERIVGDHRLDHGVRGIRRGELHRISTDHSGVQQHQWRRRQQGLEVPELHDGLRPGGRHRHQLAVARETGRPDHRPERPPGRHLHRLSDAAVVSLRPAQVAVVPGQARQDER